MFTKINEPVAVVGTYNQSTFVPKKFLWRDRVLKIDKLTFVTDSRDGGVRNRVYSVVSGGNVYRLHFNRESEEWMISEVFFE